MRTDKVPNPLNSHSPVAVANKLLAAAKAKGDTLTPLQVIKLVYLSHGFMLGLYGRPLLRENAQAWTHGPVFPSLYRAVKEFKSNPVIGPLPGDDEDFDEFEEDVIRQVYELYGGRSGIALSRLTHKPESPWSRVWDEGRGHSKTISNDLLEDYFSKLSA